MKTSLDHLPPHKRNQLATITAMLRESAPVEMVILFGSYARGNWVEDLPGGYFSDYDLMVIVASAEVAHDDFLWGKISDRARRIGGRTPVTIVAHDIREIDQELRVGQFFFSDVVADGVLLYDSHRFTLAKSIAQTPEERFELARRNFVTWFESAGHFWRGAGYYAARELGPHAAFSLHQSAERYFHAALLVYTAYKPKSHDLAQLAAQTAPLHEALAGALPRSEPEDERLFDLLKRAYIEARYSLSYHVTAEELTILRERVLDLASRVRHACLSKLMTISEKGSIGELPTLPSDEGDLQLPDLPDLTDAKAMKKWHAAIIELSYERGETLRLEGRREGEAHGRREGEVVGEARGRREGEMVGEARGRARAIVDVLTRRGLKLRELQSTRILCCRDEATLAKWWELAWTVSSVDELWDGPGA